jgi:hypothetical protein
VCGAGEVGRHLRVLFARLVRLSYLAPDISEAILDGGQPRDLTADKLLAHSRQSRTAAGTIDLLLVPPRDGPRLSEVVRKLAAERRCVLRGAAVQAWGQALRAPSA